MSWGMRMQDTGTAHPSGVQSPLTELGDGQLLALTRSGQHEAFAVLYDRYRHASCRLARHLGQRDDAEDVVSESFARMLDLLDRGKGPEQAFRAYLFATVRHECGRRARLRDRVRPCGDQELGGLDATAAPAELDTFEREIIRSAYQSLPVRWRTVLWHLDVEGRTPHELGPMLEMSANSVSALAYRARAGLRDAYLQQHVGSGRRSACGPHRSVLSAFVRGTASVRARARMRAHLQSCVECVAAYLDLREVDRQVGAAPAGAFS